MLEMRLGAVEFLAEQADHPRHPGGICQIAGLIQYCKRLVLMKLRLTTAVGQLQTFIAYGCRGASMNSSMKLGFFARAATCAAIVSIISTIGASGADLPRFDGVYIEMDTGDFIELRPVSTSPLYICEGQRRLDWMRVPEQDQLARSPQARRGAIESIFIRSRTERLERVNYALELNDFLEPLRGREDVFLTSTNHPLLSFCGRNSMFPREKIRIGQADNSIVDVTCGWNNERFRVLSESETTFQYFGRENTRLGRSTGPAAGGCGIRNTQPTVGIFIQTNQRSYFVGYDDREESIACFNPQVGITTIWPGDECPRGYELVEE